MYFFFTLDQDQYTLTSIFKNINVKLFQFLEVERIKIEDEVKEKPKLRVSINVSLAINITQSSPATALIHQLGSPAKMSSQKVCNST